MNNDFATAVKETIKHPRCRGLTFWPLADGKFQVNLAVDNLSTWIIHSDLNPLAALYKCMKEFESRG